MAVKILRLRDRVKLKIGSLTFLVGTMRLDQKAEVESLTRLSKGDRVVDQLKLGLSIIKYTLKGVEGLVNVDDSPYKLEFEEENEGALTDECVQDISNIPMIGELVTALSSLMVNPNDSIKDPVTGKELKNVTVEFPGQKKPVKKKKAKKKS